MMKKFLFISLLLSNLLLKGQIPTCSKLLFAFKNTTNISFKNIVIILPDTTLVFPVVKGNSQTGWICVKSSYSYADIKYEYGEDKKYWRRVEDFVGEKLYTSGKMTFIISYSESYPGKFTFISVQD